MQKRVGEILIELGYLTGDQVEDILNIQKQNPGKKFGKIAIENGFISNTAINAYLEYVENEENLKK